MRRTYAWRDNQLVELTPQDVQAIPNVIDDVKEFQSPDGAHIGGRAQWREHLKRTGSVELGHSDIKAAEQKWSKKRGAFQEKVQRGGNDVREATPPDGEISPLPRKELSVEMANRLYNRPQPDRKTMIQLTLETMRNLNRRRY